MASLPYLIHEYNIRYIWHIYTQRFLGAWDTALRDLWKRSSPFYKSKVTQGSEAIYDVYNKDDIMISDHLQEQVIPDIKPEKQPRPKKPKTIRRPMSSGLMLKGYARIEMLSWWDIYRMEFDEEVLMETVRLWKPISACKHPFCRNKN